ncbi:MAG TPA: phosphatase, partial [Mycobacteriales bacterium]|nr:phosphatase [Mycobacteriales bacterium]
GRALLAALDSPPDLVLADHGWAGAAAAAGLEVLGYADSNDPALFVAEQEGLDITVVGLDDNVRPHLYDPLAAYLTSWA